MPATLGYYLDKIRNLRVANVGGKPAPHKPLLLLALIDLTAQGKVTNNQFAPSTQLVEAFLPYWNLIRADKPRIFLPFYHLQSDGFWHLHAKVGQESVLRAVTQFNSMVKIAELVAYASLDENLFALLLQPDTRETIRQAIIERYFPAEAAVFRAFINADTAPDYLLDAQTIVDNAPKLDKPKRSRLFRGIITRLYDYTCAACRFRLVTLDGMTAVDAAHIKPFSISHDDTIGNGLALCKLHHWAFDNGLLSLDDDFRLLVSPLFEENGTDAFLLRRLQAQKILLPKQRPFFPSLTMIQWHQRNIFHS